MSENTDNAGLGNLALSIMDQVTTNFGEHAEIVQAMMIVEVRYPCPEGHCDSDDGELGETAMHQTVRWDGTSKSLISQLGLLEAAAGGLRP